MAKRGFNGAIMRAYGAKDHEIVVTGRESITEHFVRIHFVAGSVFDDAQLGPASWVRLWFPDDDGAEHMRGYTFVDPDPDEGTFSIDFVLHEPAGPASAWAANAREGDALQVTTLMESKFELPDELPDGYLVLGDSASIPAIRGLLETIPHDIPIEVYFDQHDPRDTEIPLPDHPRAAIHWVQRNSAKSLADAIEPRDWSNWHAWVTTESGTFVAARKRLREEFGFPKGEITGQAYWNYGRAMGQRRSAMSDEAKAAEAAELAAYEAEREAVAPPASAGVSSNHGVTTAPGADASDASSRAGAGQWRSDAAGRLLAPLKPAFILAGIAQGIVTLLQLAPFVLLVELARLLLTGASADALWTVGIWAIVLMGAGALLAAALVVVLHAVDARFARDLRVRLLDKLSRVPLGWFDARGAAGTKQVLQDDTLALHYLVTHAVPDAVAAAVAPLAVLTYLLIVDWRLGLLLLVPVFVSVVTMIIMMVQSSNSTRAALAWAERIDAEAAGFLDGQRVIRVFGGAAASTFRARLGEYLQFLSDWQRPMATKKTVMDIASRPQTFVVLIAVFGTLFITAGTMAPATILPFLLLGTTFGARLLGIGYGLAGVRDGMLAAKRIGVVLDAPELETREPDLAESAGRGHPGHVALEGVRFGYRKDVDVLRGVDLTLAPGTVTALVGPSGSGKSTLAALIARFHDVTDGTVRVAGTDVRTLSADELYAHVGFVFQDTQIVHGTVRDNIALARPDARADEVEAAARAAQIHERITQLPHGYETVIDQSTALSGGERQRITIARAILADTPILVLDEATAYADPESEYAVQRAIDALMADRTVFVIAHRLHTITGVDQILVLDDGEIVERGTHAALLAQGGRYRALWDAAGDAQRPGPRSAVDVEGTR